PHSLLYPQREVIHESFSRSTPQCRAKNSSWRLRITQESRMRLKVVLLGAALGLSLTVPAQGAVERHGWYIGLEAGWVQVNDTELQDWGYTDIEFDNRWGAMATVGYAFFGNWRAEFEAGYRNNDIDRINNLPITDGELTEWSGFFNALYDQPISPHW